MVAPCRAQSIDGRRTGFMARVPQFRGKKWRAICTYPAGNQDTTIRQDGGGMKRARYLSTGGNQFGLLHNLSIRTYSTQNQNRPIRQYCGAVPYSRESQRSRQLLLIALSIAHRERAHRVAARILTANQQPAPIGKKGRGLPCRRRLAASLGLGQTRLNCKTEGNSRYSNANWASIVHFLAPPKFFRADVADPFAPEATSRVCKRYSCRSSHTAVRRDDDLISAS